jgi:hypothetical protein
MTDLQALQPADRVRDDFDLVHAEAKVFQISHVAHKVRQNFDFVVADVKLGKIRKRGALLRQLGQVVVGKQQFSYVRIF